MQVISTRDISARARSLAPARVAVWFVTLGLAVLILFPLFRMVERVFLIDGGVDLSAFSRMYRNPNFLASVYDTIGVLAFASIGALALGTVFAWLNERTDARMGWATVIFPVVPLLLPPIVLSIGWIFLANERAGYLNVGLRSLLARVGIERDTGPFNVASMPGLLFVFTLHLAPYAYLIISSAMRNIDPALEEASRTSGAGMFRTFLRVTIGAIQPAIWSAFLLLFIVGVSSYSLAATIGVTAGVDMISVHIVRSVQSYPSRMDEAVAIGICILVIFGSLWLLQRRLLERMGHATISGRAGVSVVQLGKWRWPARALIIGYLAASSILPLAAVLLVALQPFWTPNVRWSELSLDNFSALLSGTSVARRSLLTSLRLGLIGATITLCVSALVAVLSRNPRAGSVNVADGLSKAPGAISNVVLGVAFIAAFAGPPFNLVGTMWILLLAYIVIYMPQASIAAESGVAQLPRDLIEASSIAGARQWRTFRLVIFPLILPALASGWALLFLMILGDLTASALLATTRSPVVGFVILSIWENGGFAPLAALGAVLGLLSFVVVGLVIALGRPSYMKGSG